MFAECRPWCVSSRAKLERTEIKIPSPKNEKKGFASGRRRDILQINSKPRAVNTSTDNPSFPRSSLNITFGSNCFALSSAIPLLPFYNYRRTRVWGRINHGVPSTRIFPLLAYLRTHDSLAPAHHERRRLLIDLPGGKWILHIDR